MAWLSHGGLRTPRWQSRGAIASGQTSLRTKYNTEIADEIAINLLLSYLEFHQDVMTLPAFPLVGHTT